jgi:hypothetical protein
MLPNDNIFVNLTKIQTFGLNFVELRLTRKYCDIEVIKDEVVISSLNIVTMTKNPWWFRIQLNAIAHLIKNGNCERFQSNSFYCGLCNRLHTKVQGTYGLKILFISEKYDDIFFILGECIDQLYSYFNIIVNKLGRNEFKKLFHKLFLFMNNKNILLDICNIIGKFYFLSNL